MILIDVTATYASVRDGAFHTDYRYLRERSVAGAFTLVAGATCAANIQQAGSNGGTNTIPTLFWKYQAGSFVVERVRPPSWQSGITGAFIPQTLVAPVVTQTSNTVDG